MVKDYTKKSERDWVIYSLRMRASRDGMHISGAEKILPKDKLSSGLVGLFSRAMDHGIGNPDEIHFTIEEIKDEILYTDSLPISTVLTDGLEDSKGKASKLLNLLCISEKAIIRAFDDISSGASPDRMNMRGAMFIDIDSGERLEPDHYRGVRVSRMGFLLEAEEALRIEMERVGVYGQRLKEAISLATKVSMSKTVAELCWSDNPDYTTGYVASKRHGYVRFPDLKKEGDMAGGRAFFLKGSETDLNSYITFLQEKAVLIRSITPGFSPCTWEEFLKRYED